MNRGDIAAAYSQAVSDRTAKEIKLGFDLNYETRCPC
jgi:hypothetical protein